jgi:hypothetical protein
MPANISLQIPATGYAEVPGIFSSFLRRVRGRLKGGEIMRGKVFF